MIGYPCLVRLNPNIPWKTRGNGAVCIQLGSGCDDDGEGAPILIGGSDGGSTRVGYRDQGIGRAQNQDPGGTGQALLDAASRVEQLITARAALDDDTTNPGMVLTTDPGLPLDLYWSAVRDVLALETVKARLSAAGAVFRGLKNGRGIIGAAAAVAWASNFAKDRQGSLDHTYEIIAYRKKNCWGSVRRVKPEPVLEVDRKLKSTFNNYDHELEHIAISPNSPCPVLFGVRGDEVGDLHKALEMLAPHSEPIDKWLLFRTNQGTDDHLVDTDIKDIKPFTSVIASGAVCERPHTIPGGHVIFDLAELEPGLEHNNGSRVACAAYEPTKGFRDIIRELLPGDIIKVFGGIRDEPRTINIEKLELHQLVSDTIKVKQHNPRCPKCGVRMKSVGQGKGYRCRREGCHTQAQIDQAEYSTKPRTLQPGLYEVPVAARRHLSKPLKRCKILSGTLIS